MMLIIHFIATVFMTGVIWLVQIVSYPQLRHVTSSDFIEYEKSHMQRIGFVVGPMMLLEFFTALYLLLMGMIPDLWSFPFYLSLVLGVLIALSTIFIQAPLHIQLAAEGKVDLKINRLIKSNWIRTICWSGRTLLIAFIIYSSL